jgi:TonB family protein
LKYCRAERINFVWDKYVKKYALIVSCAVGIAFYWMSPFNVNAQPTSTSTPIDANRSSQSSVDDSSDIGCNFSKYTPAVIRSIRRHWRPLAADRTKRVVVTFNIASDGSLFNNRVKDSSDSTSADEAALAAVKRSAPFKAFPLGCQTKDLPLEFTFGYQAVGGKASQRNP